MISENMACGFTDSPKTWVIINMKASSGHTQSSCVCVCECVCAQSRPVLCNPMDCKPTKFLYPRDFSGKNTEVGCHFLLWGIFLTQGLNPCLLHWQAGSSPLSHQGSPTQSLGFR